MRAGHGNAVQRLQQPSEHRRALDHRDRGRPRGDQLHVVLSHRRGDHDKVGPRNLAGTMPLGEHQTLAYEPVHLRRALLIRAAHREASREQHSRQCVHARSRYADHVDA